MALAIGAATIKNIVSPFQSQYLGRTIALWILMFCTSIMISGCRCHSWHAGNGVAG
jgi:hypothetical protein